MSGYGNQMRGNGKKRKDHQKEQPRTKYKGHKMDKAYMST
eukprot:gene5750-676_t